MESKQHTAGLLSPIGEFAVREELEVVRQYEQVKQLVCRPQCNGKTPREIAVVVPTTALRDIAANGNAGATQLIHYPKLFLLGKSPSDAVNVAGQLMRTLPYVELSEVAHMPLRKVSGQLGSFASSQRHLAKRALARAPLLIANS